MEAAEELLGFSLPPLLRALYTEVADGGYGPGYGLSRLNGGPGRSIVASDRELWRVWDGGEPRERWPEPFVRLCEWGCNFYSGLDCSRPECPVVRFNPDGCVESGCLADCLVTESDSLAEWLTAWLEGENLWHWTKKNKTARK